MHPVASIPGREPRQTKALTDRDHVAGYRTTLHSARRVGLDTPDFPVIGSYGESNMRILPHDLDDLSLYLGGLARVKDIAERMVSECHRRENEQAEEQAEPLTTRLDRLIHIRVQLLISLSGLRELG